MDNRRIHAPAHERIGRRWAPAVAVFMLLVSGCSSDGSSGAKGASGKTSEQPAKWTRATCDQGASQDQVEVEPVADVPTDYTVTSFDGAEIRIHWFPVEGADKDEPAPTILMGPGWSLAGDTSVNGGALFGALSIKGMLDAGYNVLTWDPRGFGESTGAAQVNAPDAEGRDVQVLLDWVSEQPGVRTDADGDPRVGMVGYSYGGGIQLTVAGIDCRVDALVPGLAWHSLSTSLYKGRTVKSGWSQILLNVAAAGELDPHIRSASESGLANGTLSAEDEAWFVERGPGDAIEKVDVPTLFVQGTVDTLFTLDEAITNYRSLRDRGVPTAMLWFCGGHGTCLTDAGDPDRVSEASFAWLDRYLKDDKSSETGPRFETVDQNGEVWTAPDYPLEPADPIEATGEGTLQLQAEGGSGPLPPGGGGNDVLAGLVTGITPAKATNAVNVTVDPGSIDGVALGAPRLSLSYRGTSPAGDAPTRVFAQLVDDETGIVIGNQITPIEVTLDGETHTTEIDLEVIVQHLEAGQSLTLQLVASTVAYATPRLGGEITFDKIEIDIPVAAGLTAA